MTDHVVVLGDAAVDVVVHPAAAVAPGGDVPATIRRTIGGAGANTAAWLAFLGAPTALMARVGDDPEGRRIAADLTARGVDCRFAVDPEAPTCAVVVMVDATGQRTMYSDRGAAARLAVPDLDADVMATAKHLHVSGYLLLDPLSRLAAVAALTAAAAAGVTTSVDPQTAVAMGPELLDLVGGVDLLLPNADELAALTGSPDPESARDLLDVVGSVVVTAGHAGATWVDRIGMHTAPAVEVTSVDTTGAGDAFNAGLIAALINDAPDPLTHAIATAATAVTQPGAAPPKLP
ncbi:carbohydrate kinase family protein [Labedaea rhizosphaerae]|uniref:Sugar/nucleoside kinase (Ribokinase family) n=1 Tax=Labedaea rhizosphaerae TaxID=598644 RepID=A0A4R6S0D0_LABRH|nr:PfkB family carbohydrate kinase [Labedaea rhizosphaerae]TDP92046.1 sugar/nucleoside kinase (ribokinase family) [Labedaea rhizosphaerae]